MKRSYISRRRLKTMFKWFVKNKINVEITVTYDNSLCMSQVRVYRGVITEFEIKTIGETPTSPPYEYKIIWKMADGKLYIGPNFKQLKECCVIDDVWNEESLPSETYFTDFGYCIWCNSGPNCTFSIKPIKNKME